MSMIFILSFTLSIGVNGDKACGLGNKGGKGIGTRGNSGEGGRENDRGHDSEGCK